MHKFYNQPDGWFFYAFNLTTALWAVFLWKIFMKNRICRLPAVKGKFSLSRSTIYKRVSEETLPPPISLGGQRAVGWLERELDAVIELMITGASVNEIKELVQTLVEKRQTMFKGINNE